MSKSKADEKILSYNDVVLRRSDLQILSSPDFLNDRIIEFYLSYITSSDPCEETLLVPPAISFWIKECPDAATMTEFLAPLHFPQKNLIIFPINDNDDVSVAEGGSHWSLLAFDRSSNRFVHHDSSWSNHNKGHAKRVYEAVLPYVSSDDATYFECDATPKQVNGYDCGVYVVMFARTICCWYKKGVQGKDKEGLWFSELGKINPPAVSKMRTEISGLIGSLMEAQSKH